MEWYSSYTVDLDPPKRCSNCSVALTKFLKDDEENIKRLLYAQPNRLKILRSFLEFCRNKTLNYKILDKEVYRVLT
ncbi:s-s bond formation pathway protein [Pteropox virus]|uniref:S-s bond formation pathway protein n=1 Tax=Pteropox virus TaxID=1873698 RepID=A0A1B1MRM4_9POXV|nr:s-s bond formation pathway protein [Pteropox virus]ANS71180.1 s-s bond formation pathway protein [Pteropox virus]